MGAENTSPEHVLWEDGQDNPGGLQTVAFYAPISAFADDGIPQVPANPVAFAEAVEISTDFVFKPGEGFRKLYLTEDTGMMEDESIGERDGKSWRNKMKAFHPGTKAEALGFARWANNTGLIWVVVEADGQKRIVGSEQFPAKIDTNVITTTETTDGRRGQTLESSCASITPAPIYTGNVVEYPGGSSSD